MVGIYTIHKAQTHRRRDTMAVHRHWLQRAMAEAEKPLSKGGSPHPTIKVGAVLVDAKGKAIAASSNRFAHGLDRRRPERYKNGTKSLWMNCAEQLAMMQALRHRADVKNSTLYVTLEPCAICSGMIAELGVKKVCVPIGSMRRYAKLKQKWKNSIEIGLIKLAEAGIPLITVDVSK